MSKLLYSLHVDLDPHLNSTGIDLKPYNEILRAACSLSFTVFPYMLSAMTGLDRSDVSSSLFRKQVLNNGKVLVIHCEIETINQHLPLPIEFDEQQCLNMFTTCFEIYKSIRKNFSIEFIFDPSINMPFILPGDTHCFYYSVELVNILTDKLEITLLKIHKKLSNISFRISFGNQMVEFPRITETSHYLSSKCDQRNIYAKVRTDNQVNNKYSFKLIEVSFKNGIFQENGNIFSIENIDDDQWKKLIEYAADYNSKYLFTIQQKCESRTLNNHLQNHVYLIKIWDKDFCGPKPLFQ